MNSIVQKILLVLVTAFMLCSCGDDALFDSNEVATIKQKIYVLPERYNEEPYTFNYPTNNVYLDVDQVVKFWAVYIVDDNFLHTDFYDSYITEKNWDINGEYFNINSFRYSFSDPGHYLAILKSVDKLNDSISDTMNVFVNTPISANLVAPENGYNLVDPYSKDGVDLVWNVSGLDEWEKSYCTIYAAYEKKSVWLAPQATGDCDEPGHISGPLFPNIKSDTAKTIFWGIVATHYTKDGFIEQDSTDIYSFSTKFVDTDSARIILPVLHDNLWSSDSVNTVVTLVNAKGDTLSVFSGDNHEFIFDMHVLPQTGLNIYINEYLKTDYQAQEFSINITETALYNLEDVVLVDSTAPYVEPAARAFPAKSFIDFYAYDNGSGISKSRINVINGLDTLVSTYASPVISFEPPIFSKYCFVKVAVQDNARNESPDVYWKLERIGDSTYVSGPISPWEVNRE